MNMTSGAVYTKLYFLNNLPIGQATTAEPMPVRNHILGGTFGVDLLTAFCKLDNFTALGKDACNYETVHLTRKY